jgi:tetratricopeptide (TPR) repeat protein
MIMGYLESVQKQDDQAKTYYHKGFDGFEELYKAASGADDKIAILIQYARAHEFADEVDQAAALLRKGIQDFPTSSQRIYLYYNLAQLYGNPHHKRFDEAIEICREIPSQFPNDPRRVGSYFLAANCHRFQKKYDAAAADYQEIMALFPGQREAQQAMMELRRTEDLRRRDAETSATQAAALRTSSTLGAMAGASATSPSALSLPTAPKASVKASTAPLTKPTVSPTTGTAKSQPLVPKPSTP